MIQVSPPPARAYSDFSRHTDCFVPKKKHSNESIKVIDNSNSNAVIDYIKANRNVMRGFCYFKLCGHNRVPTPSVNIKILFQ